MLASLYKKLVNAGVSSHLSEAEASKIKYLNYTIIFGIILFIPNTLYEITLNIPYTVLVDFIFICLIFISYLINIRGYYYAARNLGLIAVNFVLVGGNFAEGVAAGNYLVYIPLFFVFSIMGKVNDKFNQIIILLFITTCGLLISLFLCPEYSTIQYIPIAVVKVMFKENFIIAIILTIIFSFLIFRITNNNESQLIKAKDLAEESAKIKLQFLSNMSHELRTPLNGIIGTTNLLITEDHNKIQEEHFELLKYSTNQMLNLVNDVLDFSKIESGKIELEESAFNVETFIRNIYNSFAQQFEAKNLYFNLATEDDLNINVVSDDIRLSQILNNLLSNSLKFTHEGGVTLSVKLSQVDENKVKVNFKVSDTGIGIPANKINTVFESFMQADLNTTRKYGGTGLGLSISKKLVETFNSTISVKSELNVGTTFSFDILFLKDMSTPKIIREENDVINSLQGLRILIAEDNKVNMLIARKFLSKWGVELTEAINGKDAIEKFNIDSFDILLLDLEMPEADGYTALREIRALQKDIPAIAFTASAFDNIENILKEIGFNDYILKPFSPSLLNAKLHAFYTVKA